MKITAGPPTIRHSGSATPLVGRNTETSIWGCTSTPLSLLFAHRRETTMTGMHGGVVARLHTLGATVFNTTMESAAGGAISNTLATGAEGTTLRASVRKRPTRANPGSNTGGPRTPVKVEVLAGYLEGYDSTKTAYLVRGFTDGFMLESEGLQDPKLDAPNPPLPPHLKAQVQNKLDKEIQAGRIVGPFKVPPLHGFRVSPIKVAEKKDPGQYRFIHNLSYPYDEDSVNMSIPQDKVTVQYSTVDDAVSHIKAVGRGAYLAKTDIKSAFRIIPVHPSQHHLLGMQWNDAFFYDTTLPMGCSISCNIFEAFSTAIQWIANTKLGIQHMVHVLDDFLIIAPSQAESQHQLNKFLAFCEECGIPMAPEKTEGPSPSLTFLGITINVPNSLMLLPDDKLQACGSKIKEVLSKKTVLLRELQSMLGHLNFACRVVVPGRAFLRRAYALTHLVTQPYHHIKITKGARADFLTWRDFLNDYNGKSFFLYDAVHTVDALQLYTDSSGSIGYGAVLGGHWLHGTWPDEWQAMDITFLELYPIVLSAHIWGTYFSNQTIEFHTDNLALVSILNKCSSSKPHIMCLVRHLVSVMLKFNFVFFAIHVPGVQNILADSLSRQQIGKFKALHRRADIHPTSIPQHLKPGPSCLT